ncbi:MAG: IPTL-CTERM sorting domain-containing protein [Burkholderiales bacterium]|nr:IPTL-CTERM sorting domain-containing protein [Burkholderiales bacterium]
MIFGVYTGKSPIDLMEPFYLASELDVTVDPIFVGGTLRMNEIGQTYAQDFTLANLASSTIDQNGNHSVFSGEFTDAVAGTPGYITIAGTSGSVTFSGTNNTYTGTTTVSTGPLRAGAVNTLSPSSNMVVATNGRLELNGYSQAVAGLTHSGFISLSGSGVVGTELSTTNYIGGGILAMNTTLGVDGSPSDVLVIDSGTATGTTTLRITNVGGSGAQTTGDGILVVEAINGATTSSGAFVLETSPLIVGNYRYQLYQGGLGGSNPNNWYLRGTLISPTNLAVSVPALNPAALVLLAFALAGLALQRRRRGA